MMNYGISLWSMIPMRKEPREQSEMVSQLLFGECYQVTEEADKWIRIVSQFDHYSGWIDRKLHTVIGESLYQEVAANEPKISDLLLMNVQTTGSASMNILAGSNLPGYKKEHNRFVIEHRTYTINWSFGELGNTLTGIARQFINTPYLWGGRTSFGCDCSGFVQTVFKIKGIPLERDSSSQVNQGTPVTSAALAREGDLAFFANEAGKVIHVGMLLAPDQIIHCSGMVRIDHFDDQGIFNNDTLQYTHHLFAIRRNAGV